MQSVWFFSPLFRRSLHHQISTGTNRPISLIVQHPKARIRIHAGLERQTAALVLTKLIQDQPKTEFLKYFIWVISDGICTLSEKEVDGSATRKKIFSFQLVSLCRFLFVLLPREVSLSLDRRGASNFFFSGKGRRKRQPFTSKGERIWLGNQGD